MANWLVEQLDAKFLAHLERLQDVADANAKATLLTAQRRWYVPPQNGWSGDPQDVIGLNKAFDRDAINDKYKAVVSSTAAATSKARGRQGEAAVLKLQLDYIAAMERAYRTRNNSSIRAKIHAAARRRGHADSGGLYSTTNGSLFVWLERMLDAAHADPEAV